MKNSKFRRSIGVSSHKRAKVPHTKISNGDVTSPRCKSSKTEVELFAKAASAYSKKTTRDKQSARTALYEIGIITKSGQLTARYK